MKKQLILLFVLGLFLGMGQIFLIRDITKQDVRKIAPASRTNCLAISPECGSCPAEERNGYCYYPSSTQKFQGFPLTAGSYGYDSRTDISLSVLSNIAILAIGLPSLGFLVIKLKCHFGKKS